MKQDVGANNERSVAAAARLAHEIRRRREAAGLSQATLALMIGYSPQYVSLAERRKGLASAELVRTLDRTLEAGGELMALREHAIAEQRQLRQGTTVPSSAALASNTTETTSPEVTAIQAMSDAFQTADRRVGGGVLYAQVLRYLQTEIGPRLLNPGSTGRGLFSAAASITEIAGWMAHDGGQDQCARQHFDHAFRLASAAGNAALAANVCASMSHLAGQLGQAVDAVRIAEAGLVHADSASGTTRLVSRLHAMKARGLALHGESRGCMAALDEAERTLAAADEEPIAEWIAGFDDASFASEAALCLRQLGDFGEAERQAHRVIELRSGDRVRSRTFAQLTLARVLVDAGRIEEAAAVGRTVCAVAPSLTSTRVRTRLDQLGDALVTHRNQPEVQGFLADLRTARRTYQAPAGDNAAWPV